MDITAIRAFFLWCTVINGGLLIVSSIICAVAGDWIYRLHSRWFPISRPSFDVAIYSGIVLYKIVFITFNLVPYLALLIIG